MDAIPDDVESTRPYDIELFDPVTGFGGNGLRVVATPEQNRLNITGNLGGGCGTSDYKNTPQETNTY